MIVAVHDLRGAEAALLEAERILPRLSFRYRLGKCIVASDDQEVGARAVVGAVPNASAVHLREHQLVIERGPAWTAPIFTRAHGPTFVAASRLGPIMERSDPLDVSQIATAFDCGNLQPARSTDAAVAAVAPMTRVVVDDAHPAGQREDVDTPPIADVRGEPDELARALHARLVDAVDRATRGLRKVGLLLSGGLDSSAILAVLLQLGREVVPVTLDFAAPGDDRPHVRALEDHFGISVLRVSPKDARRFVRRSFELDGGPSRDPFHPLELACAARMHERGVERFVTGAGGDEIFGGDLGSLAGALRGGDLRALWSSLHAALPFPLAKRRRLEIVARAALRPSVPRFVRRLRARRRTFAPRWAGPALRRELRENARAVADNAGAAESGAQRFDLLARSARVSYVAEERTRNHAASNIQQVDPCFDAQLVAFMSSVPPATLFVDGIFRGLLRRALRGLLPESVRMRNDKSDMEPAFAAMMGSFEDARPFLSFQRIGGLGLVEPAAFREYIEPLMRSPEAASSGPLWAPFWGAVAAESYLAERS